MILIIIVTVFFNFKVKVPFDFEFGYVEYFEASCSFIFIGSFISQSKTNERFIQLQKEADAFVL